MSGFTTKVYNISLWGERGRWMEASNERRLSKSMLLFEVFFF